MTRGGGSGEGGFYPEHHLNDQVAGKGARTGASDCQGVEAPWPLTKSHSPYSIKKMDFPWYHRLFTALVASPAGFLFGNFGAYTSL